jgi:DNA-binding MarR family transcriptional regulator
MLNPFNQLPGFVLRQVSKNLMAELAEKHTSLGLRVSEASVLAYIKANPEASQSAIGRALDIQRANMAPLIARLCARDLIVCAAGTGKSQKIALTEKGSVVVHAVERNIAEHERGVIDRLPAHLRPHLMPILQALRA